MAPDMLFGLPVFEMDGDEPPPPRFGPVLTPDGYLCPLCDTPYPTATESVICQLSHDRRGTT